MVILLYYYHTVLFSLDFFMTMSHGVNKKTHSSAFTHLHPPTRFSPGFFAVLQEIFYQLSLDVIRLFVNDNAFSKKIRFFLLAHCWSVLILLLCLYVFFTTHFFTVLPSWNDESKAVFFLFFFFWIPRELSLRLILPA